MKTSCRILKSLPLLIPVAFLCISCMGSAGGPLAWEQIARDGFGDETNRYAWSMAVFDDELYVGTMNFTSPDDAFLYYLGRYVPGTTMGCQVWKYAPGGGWSLVADAGFDGDLANFGVRNMIVFDGALYCATVNQSTGFEMWKTSDGRSWEQVGSDGFGLPSNISARAMCTYDGYLYLGIENREYGGAMYRTGDGKNWAPVMEGGFGNRSNSSIHALGTFKGRLYAGVRNYSDGFSIWVSGNGLIFGPDVTRGGSGRQNQAVMTMADFLSGLFVGTASFPGGTQLLATDGMRWETVEDRGFGNSRNMYTWSMQEFEGRLYLGTYKLPRSGGSARNGFDLYSSADGFTWDPLTLDGLGDRDNAGARAMAVMDGMLYLGTANLSAGCQVWRARTYD